MFLEGGGEEVCTYSSKSCMFLYVCATWIMQLTAITYKNNTLYLWTMDPQFIIYKILSIELELSLAGQMMESLVHDASRRIYIFDMPPIEALAPQCLTIMLIKLLLNLRPQIGSLKYERTNFLKALLQKTVRLDDQSGKSHNLAIKLLVLV